MKKVLHITVSGRSTEIALVMDTDLVDRVHKILKGIRFAELPVSDSYRTLITDAFFDCPGVEILELQNVEIR
jgi:hypothetical protein